MVEALDITVFTVLDLFFFVNSCAVTKGNITIEFENFSLRRGMHMVLFLHVF